MKILLIAAASVEVAAEIARLVSGGGIEVHSLCPTRPEGFLRALSNRFSEADSILLTSDIFPETGLTSLIQQVRTANQNIQILVLRVAGTPLLDEVALRATGVAGAYSTPLQSKDAVDTWLRRSLTSGRSTFLLERIVEERAKKEKMAAVQEPFMKSRMGAVAPKPKANRLRVRTKKTSAVKVGRPQKSETPPKVPKEKNPKPPRVRLAKVADNPLHPVWSPWLP